MDDMRLLAESGLDWNIIEQECLNQSAISGRLWENALYERLIDLKTKHRIETPIEKSLKMTIEEKLVERTVIKKIRQGKNTMKMISQDIDEKEFFVRRSLKKMEEKGKIRIDKSSRPHRITLI